MAIFNSYIIYTLNYQRVIQKLEKSKNIYVLTGYNATTLLKHRPMEMSVSEVHVLAWGNCSGYQSDPHGNHLLDIQPHKKKAGGYASISW